MTLIFLDWVMCVTMEVGRYIISIA